MAGPVGARLLMFVAGEIDLLEPVPQQLGFPIRAAPFLIPSAMMLTTPASRSRTEPDGPPWRLVRQHEDCVQMVTQIAARHGQTVKVIDVNLAKEDRSLVQEYVDEQDVLPILVRPDRARLEGLESFLPDTIERFIAGR